LSFVNIPATTKSFIFPARLNRFMISSRFIVFESTRRLRSDERYGYVSFKHHPRIFFLRMRPFALSISRINCFFFINPAVDKSESSFRVAEGLILLRLTTSLLSNPRRLFKRNRRITLMRAPLPNSFPSVSMERVYA